MEDDTCEYRALFYVSDVERDLNDEARCDWRLDWDIVQEDDGTFTVRGMARDEVAKAIRACAPAEED